VPWDTGVDKFFKKKRGKKKITKRALMKKYSPITYMGTLITRRKKAPRILALFTPKGKDWTKSEKGLPKGMCPISKGGDADQRKLSPKGKKAEAGLKR